MFVRGQTEPVDNGRTAVVLDAGEMAFVLGEMQTMLSSVQTIVHGLATDDLAAIRETSRKNGSAMMGTVPSSLMLKLPMGFKEQGREVHAAFDELAVAVDQGETREMLLAHLDQLISRCVACHSAYRLR